MQDKNDPNVRNILSEVRRHFKCKNLTDLADYIGVSKNTVYGWIGRKSIGDPSLIIEKDKRISVKFLRTGEGGLIANQVSKSIKIENEDLQDRADKGQEEGGVVIDSRLIPMAVEVLESDSICSPALASNIRAFHKSIKNEEEMHGMKEEMNEMKRAIVDLTKEIRALKVQEPIDKKETKQANG